MKESLIKKIKFDTGILRKKICSFIYKIAPNYHCPYNLVCHVSTPNKNCFYYEGVEEEIGSYSNEIKTYEDSYGFCPVLLDFIDFVFDRIKNKKDFSKENHGCEDWKYKPLTRTREYYDCDFRTKKVGDNFKIILKNEKYYLKCVVCGKEFLNINPKD